MNVTGVKNDGVLIIDEELAERRGEGANAANAWWLELHMAAALDRAVREDKTRNQNCPQGLTDCAGSRQPSPIYRCDNCTFEGCAACYAQHIEDGHSSEFNDRNERGF